MFLSLEKRLDIKLKLKKTIALFAAGASLLLFTPKLYGADAPPTVHGLPPPAAPQRVSAAEGFPPLPLPVVPMRRSEQKRPPQPLAFASKIRIGNGNNWKGTIADLKQLLSYASPRLNISYTSNELSLKEFAYDPKTVPAIYLTGHQSVKFTGEEIEKLRNYIVNGGTIIGNACCGNVFFSTSFNEAMKEILPDRVMQPLPPEHPLYNSYYKIDKIKYRKKGSLEEITDSPNIKGINVGCRTAVILSESDMAAGWDDVVVPTAESSIDPEDASRIGTNMIAYILAEHQTGQNFAKTPVYEDVDKEKGGEFIFAQIVHGGDWDPHAGAVSNFIKKIKDDTSSDIKLRRLKVDLANSDLFSYPFLYMTGHNDFKFSEQETKNLSNYLRKGGFLFASSCCGSFEFDRAFRREMKKVLPNNELKPASLSSMIYDSFYTIEKVSYTKKVEMDNPGMNAPHLEEMDIEGFPSVVYSPFGLVWDDQVRPYSSSVMPEDSVKLGINTIVMGLSH